jgi:hypothetical protein
MALDGKGLGGGWNSKNIENIYGIRALSDVFFQNSHLDTRQFKLMQSDATNLYADGSMIDRCFLVKTDGGAHDYGIMFKRDERGDSPLF